MKRTLILSLFLSVFIANDDIDVLAQKNLTSLQYKSYNQNKLAIEKNNFIEWAITGNKWTAYKSLDKISHAKFFKISGYEKQAKKIKSNKIKSIVIPALIFTSDIIVIGVTAGMYRGASTDFAGIYIGLAVSGILSNFYFRIKTMSLENIPLKQAQLMADSYNRKIYKEIQSK